MVAATIGTLVFTHVSPVHAATYCGSEGDILQNVFEPNGAEGSWTNALNWSRHHLPQGGETLCVPGGTVALVPDGTVMTGNAENYYTTLNIEGTVRIQEAGASVRINLAYGGTNLVNGGVIQVLNGSTLDMEADQGGSSAYQNVAGGLIQVSAGSTISLLRPFVNNGTIDLTGGGKFTLNSANSAFSGSGTVIGGKVRVNAGAVTFGGGGAFGVLGVGGDMKGTVGANQSLDMACDTWSSGVNLPQGLVNNGTVRFVPSIAGDCTEIVTIPGGTTFTNNGTFIIGEPGPHTGIHFASNFYSRDGEIVNGPTGTMVINDYFQDHQSKTTNNGTMTITAGGFFDNNHSPFVNNGTFTNAGSCDVGSLTNSGVVELQQSCNVRTVAAFGSTSTLRVHSSSGDLTKISGMNAASTIAGAVDVVTDVNSPPALGTIRDVFSAPASGQFATVTSQSPTISYIAVYPANSGGKAQLQAVAGSGSAINAMVPARLLDTRPGGSTVDHQDEGGGAAADESVTEIQIIGRADVPANASAAVLNVTVTGAVNPGFVTVFPCGSTRPNASHLNFGRGSTVANGVIAKIGNNGKVCLYVSNGTNLLADVAGFFSAASPFVALVPGRLLDTRPGGSTLDHEGEGAGLAAAGSITEIKVTDRAGVPADAAAVALNITATGAHDAGYATVYPCGSAQPNASHLNFSIGSTVPNNVIAKVGANGKVCVYVSGGTHLLADVGGYFKPSAAFQAIVPGRLLDTRPGGATVDGQGKGAGLSAAGTVTEVKVADRGGVPSNASAVVLNVTATGAQDAGYVTIFPCGTAMPNASSLNYISGSTVPNGVIAKVGANGKVCLYVSGGTHLLTDVAGYFVSQT